MRTVASILFCLAAVAAAGAADAAAAHPFLAENAKAVVTADGKRAEAARITDKPLVLIYFSAHWCPPCRTFTPELVDFYAKKGGGTAFEVLFVSSDKAQDAMMGYMTEAKMPWVAMQWGASKIPAVKKKYGGPGGIPCLVLLDAQDEVLAHSYDGEEYLGPRHVLKELDKRLAASK
ncbi:MAG TPA: thioredoxin-like domain-containing protein [Planctomycetota bacterium]|nr:thioredoxin-like domain-containing protein [Planctomycetota bacterium]